MATKKKKAPKQLLAQIPLDPPVNNILRMDTSRFKTSAISNDSETISKLSFTFNVPPPKVPPTSEAGGTKFFGHFPVSKSKNPIAEGKSFIIKKTRATIKLDIFEDEGTPAIMTIELNLSGARVKKEQ